MLAIRLQRLGRKGYPVYRVVVQESQRHPSSGRVVAYIGSYNPHTKEHKLDHEKAEFYLGHGARPTSRVVKIMKQDKIKLPDWVEEFKGSKERQTRFPDKLRKNQPKEEAVPATDDALANETTETSSTAEAPTESDETK